MANSWTAPNVIAFMLVTTHYLDSNFEMKTFPSLTSKVFCQFFLYLNNYLLPDLSSPGNHTGKMFVELFYEELKKYWSINKIHTITANNTLNNNKMAWKLSLQILSFNPPTHLLGCVAHVIKQDAKAGIADLGSLDSPDEGKELSTSVMGWSTLIEGPAQQVTGSQMGINFMTATPDGVNINAASPIFTSTLQTLCSCGQLYSA
ncbi:hypothetical protein PGTUg99_024462 [Puccinia graminis f. sp. tritici]|nr:hypothetical protein PGTUg99_024462 [Puccinia graminis f. sp. tritici]